MVANPTKKHAKLINLCAVFLSLQVMIFSFMGEHNGRILQAHFDGEELVVRKLQLCDFSTKEKAQDNIQLFLRYMASEPVGDTRSLPLPCLVSRVGGGPGKK